MPHENRLLFSCEGIVMKEYINEALKQYTENHKIDKEIFLIRRHYGIIVYK